MADGPPSAAAGHARRVVAEAAAWLVRLQAGADTATLDAWRRWHDADAEHAAVWRRYAALQRMVPGAEWGTGQRSAAGSATSGSPATANPAAAQDAIPTSAHSVACDATPSSACSATCNAIPSSARSTTCDAIPSSARSTTRDATPSSATPATRDAIPSSATPAAHGAIPASTHPAAQALKMVASRRGRRQALKLLCGGGAALAAGSAAWRLADTEGWLAQTRTAVGEQRALTLSDGTRLLLNTRTAIDIHEKRHAGADAARIEVTLHAGEMLVDNRQGGDGAGLRLCTRHGYVEPYSARLLLRQLPECSPSETLAAVQEGTARVAAGGRIDVALQAGEARRFDNDGFQPPQVWRERDLAWTQGVLIADDMRLDDLLRQLARYRHGRLDCDDAVAARRVTGTFRIHDTDRVLEALAHHLGLRLRYRTRYWVTLRT